MKTYFKILIILIHFNLLPFGEARSGFAQINLVPNYSFEELNSCPLIGTASCNNIIPIPSLKDWYCAMTYLSSPDYFNNCTSINFGFNNICGWQIAKTGNAYLGGFMHTFGGIANNEYIECTLKDSLKPNVNYCVQYYLNRSDKSSYVISQHGAVFTKTQLIVPSTLSPHFINLTPQVKNPLGNYIKDSINWTKIEGSFIALGGERHMTLGCFGPQSLLDTLFDPYDINNPFPGYREPYIYLDDVSVEEVLNAQAGNDQLIDCGNSVVIGADSAIGATYKWFPSTGLDDDTKAFPIANPTITTNYVLQKTQCKIITYDTVKVKVTNTCPYINYLDEFKIPNVFTPNGDNANDVWQFTLGFGNNLKGLHIYDRWGLEIKSSQIQTQSFIKWDGYTTAGEPCTAGVYFYTLEYSNVLGEQKKLNGYITLIR